jgi:hypothetical protein
MEGLADSVDRQIKEALMKLPPNYPVETLYVSGGSVDVVAFSSYAKGLAYFINADCQVLIVDDSKIDGISFIQEN